MFRKLRELYGSFRQTLEDGHYCQDNSSVWSDLWDEIKGKLPEMPKIDIAKKLPVLAKIFKSKLVWSAALAAVSIQSIVGGALAVAGAGVSFYAMEFMRCRRAKEQIITEVNFAGQTVRGKRKDLSRLHKAQEKINHLSGVFNGVAVAPVQEEVDAVIDSVREQQRRIMVVEAGTFGAGAHTYEFSLPHVRKTAPADTGLKDAWDKGKDEEIVQRILELERALPQEVKEKLRQRRMDAPAMVPAPPAMKQMGLAL